MQGKPFEYFIMTVIVANSALMATAFYGQPPEMTAVVEAINYVFTCIYVMEFALKVNIIIKGCLIARLDSVASTPRLHSTQAQHYSCREPAD